MPAQFLGFDHIDVRVRSLAAVERFYDELMPALGLSIKSFSFVDGAGEWHAASARVAYNTVEYWEPGRPGDRGRFIGFIEDATRFPCARASHSGWKRSRRCWHGKGVCAPSARPTSHSTTI
jgi:hypothetical protein